MRKLLLILLISFSGISLNAQTNLDSLYTVWQDETQTDSIRVRAYYSYVWDGFLSSNPDTAMLLADELIVFAKKVNSPKWHSSGLLLKGLSNYFTNNYHEALDYYKQCLKIKEQLGDQKGTAFVLCNVGVVYDEQGDYPRALDYFTQGLKIFEELDHKTGMATILSNIGNIFNAQGEQSKALSYYNKGFKINEEVGDQYLMGGSLHNIGNVYFIQGEYPKALDYHNQSLKIREEVGDQREIAKSLSNIGRIYQEQSDHLKALDFYTKSLKINEQLDDQGEIALQLRYIGGIYKIQGNYPIALDYCKRGYELALSVDVWGYQKKACQCLYDTYKAMGNGKEALMYHEQLTVLNDSLFNEENTKKLTQLEMQYDFDKKEAITQAEQEKKDAVAAQELKRQKLVRNGFMGGFGVVLLFAGVFFRQRNRISKEKARSEELLLNILPEETARELKEKGHSEAQLIDQVTVLFTDFKGFTAMSEALSPKALVADLHACFSEFDLICEKYGIEKIKTIGDAYMAAGGLPTPNQTHATDVVKAAIEMAEVVTQGKADKMAENLPFFEVRIGVHTGPVVAGIVGIKKFQYDIWGDTVNTASRMESHGKVAKVNISQATYELLKNDSSFSFESRGKIEAKGKGEVDMYFVSLKA